MRCVLTFLILMTAFSCSIDTGKKKKKTRKEDQLVKDGISRAYYPDGKLRAEIPMKGGRRNGLAIEYYNDGKKHLEINYADGKHEGLTTRYWENGNLYEQTNYSKGEMHGIRKRYRKDGKLASESRFNSGAPCLGLQEFLQDGSAKKKYPTIVIEPVDMLLKEQRYALRLSMSDKSGNVTFYEGDLDGGCIGYLEEIPKTTKKGVSELSYYLPEGMFVMKTLNIIARVKTAQGNFFVTQRKYNLAIEH
jgi:antitoxin component YwqK of YwqJK toxin-antitoxin module